MREIQVALSGNASSSFHKRLVEDQVEFVEDQREAEVKSTEKPLRKVIHDLLEHDGQRLQNEPWCGVDGFAVLQRYALDSTS